MKLALICQPTDRITFHKHVVSVMNGLFFVVNSPQFASSTRRRFINTRYYSIRAIIMLVDGAVGQ